MPLPSELDPRRSWPGFLLAAGIALTVLFTLLQPDISQGLSGLSLVLFWAAHVMLPLGLLQLAQSALSRFPRFAADLFEEGVAQGFGQQEVSALIKVLRARNGAAQ